MYLSEGQLACGCSHVLGGGIEEPGPGRAQQLDGDASGFLLLQIDNNRTEKDVRPYIQVLENKSKSSQHLHVTDRSQPRSHNGHGWVKQADQR